MATPTDKSWVVSKEDILALEIGAGILGTGGGGNPYLGKLRALEVLKAGHEIEILPLSALADDAKIVPLGGVGAPVVGVERLKEGREGVRALRALEDRMGFKADAFACQEIGGANSMEPLIMGALAGIPIVDADGMGRAFPEMQMTTYSIYGHKSTPSAMADPHGNIVIFDHAVTELFHERMVRATVVAQGGSSTLALAPMTGAFVKKFAIPHSYSKAANLGRAVLNAKSENQNIATAICQAEDGHRVFSGKIIDLRREMDGGFVKGEIVIQGHDDWQDQSGEIHVQNEFLIFKRNGEIEVIVPDLIVVLDADEGTAISTDMLRYGQRIDVLALPAHPLLCTPEALEVIGPNGFGFDDLVFPSRSGNHS